MDIHTGRVSVLYITGLWMALVLAVLLMALYLWSLTEEARHTSEALKQTEAELAREQNMSSLGGLAAAAAHELGSPLATIFVVAKELVNDLPEDSPYREDVELLQSQALRCRDILASLAQQPLHIGGQDFEKILLTDLIELAKEDHLPDDIELTVSVENNTVGAEPILRPDAETLQGLGNLFSNAGQFAKSKIEVALFWDQDNYRIIIRDDGPGFSAAVMERVGEPYISTRAGEDGHMGLGLFITQTLLQRIGARLRVGNRSDRNGAEVTVLWNQPTKSEYDIRDKL